MPRIIWYWSRNATDHCVSVDFAAAYVAFSLFVKEMVKGSRLFHDHFLGDVIGFNVLGFGGQHDIVGIHVLLHMRG